VNGTYSAIIHRTNTRAWLPPSLENSNGVLPTGRLQPAMARVQCPTMRLSAKPSPLPCRAPASSPSGADDFVYPIQDGKWDELWGGHTLATPHYPVTGPTLISMIEPLDGLPPCVWARRGMLTHTDQGGKSWPFVSISSPKAIPGLPIPPPRPPTDLQRRQLPLG
jgi:hypothetical protein